MHERRWQQRLARRPVCLGCNAPIDTELCLDLRSLNLAGQLCESCISRHTRYTEDLENA